MNQMKPECITYPSGTQIWYLNGMIHREDGPAVIETDGTQEWRLNGERHREDGPAVIYPDGTQVWYRNDLFHREDGPAIIRSDGTQYWWFNDTNVTTEVKSWAYERNIDLNNLSNEDKAILKLEMKMWKN